MARGWESKSVEQQQDEAASVCRELKPKLTPAEVELRRQRQGLRLSRQRVLEQLENARNPTHRKMLEAAVAELDAKLARLG